LAHQANLSSAQQGKKDHQENQLKDLKDNKETQVRLFQDHPVQKVRPDHRPPPCHPET
jgi:hypothetical protein